MKANSLNTLLLVGDQCKDNACVVITRHTHPLLFTALDCYPLHAFSPEGRCNLCARFKLTDGELEAVLVAYERPNEPTEEEQRATNMLALLRVIETAIAPTSKLSASKVGEGGHKK